MRFNSFILLRFHRLQPVLYKVPCLPRCPSFDSLRGARHIDGPKLTEVSNQQGVCRPRDGPIRLSHALVLIAENTKSRVLLLYFASRFQTWNGIPNSCIGLI